MGKYFGTDGFRGEANKQLTVEHAFKVGRLSVGITVRQRINPVKLSSARIQEEAVICLNMRWLQG